MMIEELGMENAYYLAMKKLIFRLFVLIFLTYVPLVDNSPALTLVDKPLDASGYGFTSNYGQQNVLEDFTLSFGAKVNKVTWYGLFSFGTVATTQSIADFDLLFYR